MSLRLPLPLLVAALRWSLVVAVSAPAFAAAQGAEPLAVRIENLLVTPAHGPLVRVWVQNLGQGPYEGQLSLNVPEGWRTDGAALLLKLAAGQSRRVAFNVQHGVSVEQNSYRLEAVARRAGSEPLRHVQQVVAATSPYFKPTIDGKPDDWADAVPVRFRAAGRWTEVRSYWNRNQFSLLVAVEEDKLHRYQLGKPFDAVQVAIAAEGTQTGDSADGASTRWEYLLVSTGERGAGRCFQLAQPGTPLRETQGPRALEPLAYNIEIAVWRTEKSTYYECAIPWRPIREQIPPSEGRELCFSLLVHDPDGTGLRDWGEAAGLWPPQRNRLAWSDWQGAQWAAQAPFDNKIEWGFCASKF